MHTGRVALRDGPVSERSALRSRAVRTSRSLRGRCLFLNDGDVCQRGVCVAGAADNDGDGVSAFDDCDDFDESIYPGAPEQCNGIDDDCDQGIDETFDEDGDGFSGCSETIAELFDCDDSDAWIHPGASERCNGLDDNCDEQADEDFECVMGDAVDCWTACDTTGRGTCDESCRQPSPSACDPPEESCNTVDDDCDGFVDEDFIRFRCPLTEALGDDQALCDGSCQEVRTCEANVNTTTVTGAATYSGQCQMRIVASGDTLTFYQQREDWDGGCDWGEDTIGTVTLDGATASGSVSYGGQCQLRIAASGNTLTFYQQREDWDGGCDWGEDTIGTITLDGATVTGAASYSGRCSMRVSASGGTLTFYQQREDWDGGCDWGEDTAGSVTLGDVTTFTCPGSETLLCGGEPPSCTVTDTCDPVVICETS